MLLLIITFIAGALTVLAPCVLPLLPVIVGGSLSGNLKDKKRPYIIAGSLIASIIIFTLLLKVSTALIGLSPKVLTDFSGGLILALGLAGLFPSTWEALLGRLGWQAKAQRFLGQSESNKDEYVGPVLIGVALGYITYCGVEYKGNHQPLVTPAVFAACETVRSSRYVRENRHRKHYPYLSRMLLCGKCQRHMCYMLSRKPNRQNYEYFFCMNRRDNGCPQVYIPMQLIKEAVVNAIKQLEFSDSDRQKLTAEISKELASEQRYAETDVKQQTGRRDRLLAERDNLMQAYYDKVIQDSLLKSEQKRIAKEIEQAEDVISEAEERLAIINARRDRALELASGLDIGKAYVKANDDIKRHFCLALFSKIEVDDNPVYHSDVFRAPRDHHVRVTKVHWHDPINIRHITEAILALSLERGKRAPKPKKIKST